MKLFHFKIAIALFISSSFFISCDKDDDENVQPDPVDPKIELIAGNNSKTWRLVNIKISTGVENLSDCEADNTLTFRTDSTYTDNKGAIACPEDTFISNEANWEFDQNFAGEEKLYLGVVPYDVLELNQNSLKIKQVVEYHYEAVD